MQHRIGEYEGVALRKESVDRNTKNPMISVNEIPSLSARRAWIEITCEMRCFLCLRVALRKESVDRNTSFCPASLVDLVALRKESVDRNLLLKKNRPSVGVALRKESVDRNIPPTPTSQTSSRVALRKESVDRNMGCSSLVCFGVVALRKESVDRNLRSLCAMSRLIRSLSARRAWIEIVTVCDCF